MADPFVAEIRVFPFNFPPKGWAFCNGQLMPLSQNTALFSLLGTTYGGNGQSNFALPDLQGRAPLQADQGPGLTLRHLGEQGGADTVTLTAAEMPSHSHGAAANADPAELQTPAGDRSLARSQNASAYQSNTSGSLVALAPAALGPAGGSQPHNNLQPYLAMNFCIALQGVFPPRS